MFHKLVWSDIMSCGMALYGTVLALVLVAWYGMVYMVWYGMAWYGMVWYGMVWYGMVYVYINMIMSCDIIPCRVACCTQNYLKSTTTLPMHTFIFSTNSVAVENEP